MPTTGLSRSIPHFLPVGDKLTGDRHEAVCNECFVLDSIADGIQYVDADCVIRYTNPAFDAMFGYEPGELCGRHVSVLNDPAAAENAGLAVEIHTSLSTSGAWRGEIRNRKKDGTPFVTEATIRTLPVQGRAHWVSVQRDVTERKRSEQQLRESEERLQALLGALPDLVFRLAPDGTILDYHGGAGQELYAAPAAFLGRRCHEILPSPLVGNLAAAVARARDGQLQTFDYELLLPEAGRQSFEARVQTLPCGQLLVLCRNVSEQRRAEQALRGSEARYRSLVEMAPDGIAIIRNGRVAYLNRAAVQLAGAQSADELLGLEVYDYVHPDDLSASRKRLAQIDRDHRPLPLHEIRFRRLDGAYRTVETCSAACEFDGAPAVQAIIRDVSERKRAEAELERRLFERTILSRLGVICSAARAVDDVLWRATTLIAGSLFPHNCGFLLLDPDRGVLVPHVSFVENYPHVQHGEIPLHVGIIGRAARTGQAQRVADVRESPDYLAIDAGTKSELCVPIKIGGQVVGAINVESGELDAFSAADEQLLGAIADLVGNTLQRLRAEDALRASEERLRLVIGQAPAMLWTVDRQLRINLSEGKALAGLGLRPAQLVGCSLTEYLHDGNARPELLEYHRRAIGGESVEYVTQWVNRTLECRLEPLRDAAGEVIGCLGVGVDVTERTEAEAALREAQQRLALIVSGADVGTWDWDLATNEVVFSREWKQQLGYAEDEIANRFAEWQSRVHQDDLEPTLAKVRASILRRSGDHEAEFRMRHKDGTWRWILARGFVQVGTDGQPVRMLGIHVDITDRKRAEEALRASESRLRAIIEAEPECVKLVSPDCQLLEMNSAGLAMLEVQSLAEARRQPLLEYLLPPFRAPFAQLHERVLRGQSGRLEFELEGRRGTRRWMDTNAVPLCDDSGHATAHLAITRDITDRKRAEQALLRQKRALEQVATGQPLREVLEEIAAGVEEQLPGSYCSILLLEPDTLRLRCAAVRSLPADYNAAIDGVRIGPAVGSCGTAAYRGETVIVADIATDPLWADYCQLALAHGLKSCWSVPILAGPAAAVLDQSSRVLGTFALYRQEPAEPTASEIELVAAAAHLAGIAIARDRAESALRQSEERYRLIAELSSSFSYQATVAAERRVECHWIGGSFADVTGYRPDELGAGGWFELVSLEDLPIVEELLAELCSAPAAPAPVRTLDLRIVTRSGELRWVRAMIHPVAPVRLGEPAPHYGAVLDITDRKRAEDALAARQAELLHAARLSTVGQMVATLSHEVAQPLAAIGNYAAASGMLLDAVPSRPWDALREYVDAIVQQSERCGAILKRLRDFSRRAPTRRSICDLNELLSESVELAGADLRRHNVQVQFDLAEPLPPVHVDRVQLQQVVVNLLANARDAVRDCDDLRRTVQVTSRAERDAIVFEIADRGVGLTEEVARHLFEPFFTSKDSGMGLGLSICRSIVQDHGGQIEAAPNPRGGATLRVRLPRESRS